MNSKTELTKLKDNDLYSMILFCLFKLREIPEYSTLSEMAYLLDKESLLNICEFFGGMMIKVPTISELESIVYSLVLYQYVNLEGMEYDKATKMLGVKSSKLRQIKIDYVNLCNILDKYEFKKRNE